MPESKKAVAIVALQPVLRGEPNEALVILRCLKNGTGSEPFFLRYPAEDKLRWNLC